MEVLFISWSNQCQYDCPKNRMWPWFQIQFNLIYPEAYFVNKPSGRSPGFLPLPSHNLNPLELSQSPEGIKIQNTWVFTLWQLIYKVTIHFFCISPLILCIPGIPHRILNQICTRNSARYFHKYHLFYLQNNLVRQ